MKVQVLVHGGGEGKTRECVSKSECGCGRSGQDNDVERFQETFQADHSRIIYTSDVSPIPIPTRTWSCCQHSAAIHLSAWASCVGDDEDIISAMASATDLVTLSVGHIPSSPIHHRPHIWGCPIVGNSGIEVIDHLLVSIVRPSNVEAKTLH